MPDEPDRHGYSGAVLGACLWMGLGGAVLCTRTLWLGVLWLAGCAAGVAWAVWLWRHRTRWSYRSLLMRLLAGIAGISVVLFGAASLAGQGAFLHLTSADAYSGWAVLLVFPLVAFILWRTHAGDDDRASPPDAP